MNATATNPFASFAATLSDEQRALLLQALQGGNETAAPEVEEEAPVSEAQTEMVYISDPAEVTRHGIELADDPDNFRRVFKHAMENLDSRPLQIGRVHTDEGVRAAVYVGTYYPSVECWAKVDYWLVAQKNGMPILAQTFTWGMQTTNARRIGSGYACVDCTDGELERVYDVLDHAISFLCEH